MTQNINYDQIAPGNLTPFYASPGAPAAPATRGTQAFLNTLDAAKVEQEEKPE